MKPVANMLAKGSKCRWGNYNSSVIFPFSISLETDPLVNLSNTKSIMDRKKYSLAAGLLYSNSKFIMNLFGPKVYVEISELKVVCFFTVRALCDTCVFVGRSSII